MSVLFDRYARLQDELQSIETRFRNIAQMLGQVYDMVPTLSLSDQDKTGEVELIWLSPFTLGKYISYIVYRPEKRELERISLDLDNVFGRTVDYTITTSLSKLHSPEEEFEDMRKILFFTYLLKNMGLYDRVRELARKFKNTVLSLRRLAPVKHVDNISYHLEKLSHSSRIESYTVDVHDVRDQAVRLLKQLLAILEEICDIYDNVVKVIHIIT